MVQVCLLFPRQLPVLDRQGEPYLALDPGAINELLKRRGHEPHRQIGAPVSPVIRPFIITAKESLRADDTMVSRLVKVNVPMETILRVGVATDEIPPLAFR